MGLLSTKGGTTDDAVTMRLLNTFAGFKFMEVYEHEIHQITSNFDLFLLNNAMAYLNCVVNDESSLDFFFCCL